MTMANTRATAGTCRDQRFAPLPITAALVQRGSASPEKNAQIVLFASSAVDAASLAMPHGACRARSGRRSGDAELDGLPPRGSLRSVRSRRRQNTRSLRCGHTGCASPSAIPSRHRDEFHHLRAIAERRLPAPPP